MILLPPPTRSVLSTNLPRHVYTINTPNTRQTYFGIHLPTRSDSVDFDVSHTCILAFVDKNAASQFAKKLCRHRAATKQWPERVLNNANELVLQSCPGEPLDNPINVQEHDADTLLNELSIMDVYLGLIKDVETRHGNFVFKSINSRLVIENTERSNKLDELFQHQ